LVRVGVLALQGDFLEHVQILRELDGVEPVAVKRVDDLSSVDALIIPGGESTTIGSLIVARGLADKIASLAESGTPIMGTCAGAVLLAKSVSDKTVGPTDQFTLKLMNIEVVRNAFGRQRAAFIRAPEIKNAWPPARITGFIDYPGMGRVGVSAQQDSLLALAFHPEITGEKRVYEYFLRLVKA